MASNKKAVENNWELIEKLGKLENVKFAEPILPQMELVAKTRGIGAQLQEGRKKVDIAVLDSNYGGPRHMHHHRSELTRPEVLHLANALLELHSVMEDPPQPKPKAAKKAGAKKAAKKGGAKKARDPFSSDRW